MNEVPEVLFVCIHNAGRSQMAAALLDHHAQGRVSVRSGGSAPGEHINPAVANAMAEIGLDLSKEFPKPVTDAAVRAADVVITMSCGDVCPIYPGKRAKLRRADPGAEIVGRVEARVHVRQVGVGPVVDAGRRGQPLGVAGRRAAFLGEPVRGFDGRSQSFRFGRVSYDEGKDPAAGSTLSCRLAGWPPRGRPTAST